MMSRHLALFLPELRAGGAQRVMLTLAKAFIERGDVVDLLLARKEGAFLDEVPAGVNLIDMQAKFMGLGRLGLALSVLPGLVSYLRSARPDALLSTLTGTNLIAIVARWISRVPIRLVVREASVLSNLRNPIYIFLMARLYRYADAVLTLSAYSQNELSQKLGLPESLFIHIPNPVDIGWIKEKAAQPCPHDWLRPGNPPILISAGRLAEPKDFETLIRAFNVFTRSADARLVILGDGPQKGPLAKLIESLQLESRVLMAGYDSNPYRWIARSNGFILSSRWEGQPNALIEAMCLDTPVVATDYNSSIYELVGEAGEVVPVGDEQAMASALQRLLHKTPALSPACDVHGQRSVDQYERLLFAQCGLANG